MPVEIRKVTSSKEMRTFITFANKLYRNHPCYVPNLVSDDAATFDRRKNFAFEFCEADYFLAYRDGNVVGRVAAIINRKANAAWNVRQVRFGWIDFIEDMEVLEALVSAVADWGRERGMTDIAGPLGFTDFDPEGMLVEGFDPETLFVPSLAAMFKPGNYHLQELTFYQEALERNARLRTRLFLEAGK